MRSFDDGKKLAIVVLEKYQRIVQESKRAEGDYRWYQEKAEEAVTSMEKEMYQDMAEQALKTLKLCKRWKWIVDADVKLISGEKSRFVLKRNFMDGVPVNKIVTDGEGTFFSRSMVTRYKSRGLTELSAILDKDKDELTRCENGIFGHEP